MAACRRTSKDRSSGDFLFFLSAVEAEGAPSSSAGGTAAGPASVPSCSMLSVLSAAEGADGASFWALAASFWAFSRRRSMRASCRKMASSILHTLAMTGTMPEATSCSADTLEERTTAAARAARPSAAPMARRTSSRCSGGSSGTQRPPAATNSPFSSSRSTVPTCSSSASRTWRERGEECACARARKMGSSALEVEPPEPKVGGSLGSP
mmetsp:Transcript_37404/g.105571  ORF Transcript_37404/g.105571 Transcript_37404/m.105571 type:complete len:210 (-) Transcript_37404:2383-3012(-)